MFGRLIQKELLNYLLDFRFVAIFMLSVLLSVLSVYVGVRNYRQQLEQQQVVTNAYKERLASAFEKGGGHGSWDLTRQGIIWNREPEVLSPVVFGMSGKLGNEVHIQYPYPASYEDSLFSVDPIHALFGILDFAFIVKVILSLCVLLLTYDMVCGEKESGTFRLVSSFAVSRSAVAISKLAGATIGGLVPLLFSFLLISSVMALSQDLDLKGDDWVRMWATMMVFGLYLLVFISFGLFLSSVTHRRMTAFLALLGLWTIWVFIIPNLGLRVSQSVEPAASLYDIKKQSHAMRWDANLNRNKEQDAYWEKNRPADSDSISASEQQKLRDGEREIRERWDTDYFERIGNLYANRRNQLRAQQSLLTLLSAISPLSAVSYTSMDLARTGLIQQEHIEDEVNIYSVYLARYLHRKRAEHWEDRKMRDFSWFSYEDTDTIGECLSRNTFHILNLVLLSILGFAGAYVGILRYDVR
jgi:ABC-type transport system involved in multi-copper enzyme maturation permease subunit